MGTLKKYLISTVIIVVCPLFLMVGQSSKNKSSSNGHFLKELIFRTIKPKIDSVALGTIIPLGPPIKPPARISAGNDCIVDLVQEYEVIGTLSGRLKIDYRIMVHGPCGTPPGTYDEELIAHGTFVGKVRDTTASGSLSYIADVKVGGNVSGKIVFGQGITGELEIKGNFKDGKLLYEGWIY